MNPLTKDELQFELYQTILIGITAIIYCITIPLLYINRFNPFNSIRSEKLVQMGNLGIFLTIIIQLLKHSILHEQYYPEYLIITCHYLMIISIIFRFLRIILCTQIKFPDDDLINMLKIKSKKYHYEFLYMRYLLISTFGIFVILLSTYFIVKSANKQNEEDFNNNIMYLIWVIIHSIDMIALLTIGLYISSRSLGYYIKTEYLFTCLILYAYSFTILLIQKLKIYDKNQFYCPDYYHVGFLLALMIFISSFPFIAKRLNKKHVFYKFTPELTTDLYLYLSNEECFNQFYNYLSHDKLDNKGVYLLELYLKLIRLKMMFNESNQSQELQSEIINIYNEYFSHPGFDNDYISNQDKTDIQIKYKELIKTGYSFEVFNCGLTSCFKYLLEKFKDYQLTQEFFDLQIRIKYDCYIQLKLFSSGLISLNKDD